MPDRTSNCPRCQLSLQTEEYEGQDVLFCGTCWGHWLDHKTFNAIVANEIYTFGKDESLDILATWADRNANEVALTPAAACPECGAVMEQGPVDERCPVVIDRCERHGVWLDTAEIKQIQVFVDSSRRSET